MQPSTPFSNLTLDQRRDAATKAARRSLTAYCAFQWPGYQLGNHLLVLAEALERLERGEIKRLLVQMPPRHGKSLMTSTYFPAWYLGRNPDHYVMTATYGQDLADDFGRQVRNQLADPQFQLIFPGVGLAPGGRAASRFIVEDTGQEGGFEHHLNRAGAYYGVGVGGPVTGRGAHLLVIDDPIKNREEADSEIVRLGLKSWYTSTAYTRLMPGGKILVIQTRWQEDDLSGWLEAEHARQGWTVIRMPALCDDPVNDPLGRELGAALWPEYGFDEAWAEETRLMIGARDWSALYQQKPAPDTGLHFTDKMFLPRAMPADTRNWRFVGASDYAVTAKTTADWSVHLVGAIDDNGNPWIVDAWRDQLSVGAVIEKQVDMMRDWLPLVWADEAGVIHNVIEEQLIAAMRRRNTGCALRKVPSIVDKLARAQQAIGLGEMKGYRIPLDAPWWPSLRAELLSFPSGKNDDQGDALGLLGGLLTELQHGGIHAKGPKREEVNPAPPGSIPASLLIPNSPRGGGKRIAL